MEYTIRKLYKEIDEQTKQFDNLQRQYVVLQQQYHTEKEIAFGKVNDAVSVEEFNELKRYANEMEKQFEVSEQQLSSFKMNFEMETKKSQQFQAELKGFKDQKHKLQTQVSEMSSYIELKDELINRLQEKNKQLDSEIKKANQL